MSGTQHELTIHPSFEGVLRPLSEEEFTGLEGNILQDRAIYEPVVVWRDPVTGGPIVFLSLLDSSTKMGAYTTKDNVGYLPPIDWTDSPKDMREWSMLDVMLWLRVIEFQQKRIA